ncbi:hypothetical protein MMC11_000526 [Xylographa trunciseda]|nr:hypothetical protein [Xylographa trunciseda]
MYTPTEAEFDGLPIAVRRKCFSTLERLRLAQASINCTASCHSTLSKSTPTTFTSRLRRSKRPHNPADVSPEDAQWYQRLPDTVRRKQFTAEEQLVFGGKSEAVILDAADEAIYRLGRHSNRSLPSLQSSSSSRSSSFSIDTIDLGESVEDMDDAMMDSFRWIEEDNDLDLTLDYHNHIAEVADTKPSSRRPSFRRNLSLTNLPFVRDTRTSTDRAPSLSGRSSRHSTSTPRSRQRHSSVSRASCPIFDPGAAHYNDPEARLKLRVYLASPQKFDEAIEFGFPSIQRPSGSSSRRPSTAAYPPKPPTANAQTFYDDDNASLDKDVEGGDTASLTEPNSPETPLDSVFRPSDRLSSAIPPSSEQVRPHMWHTASDPYVHGRAGDREMTLRMTLTRPDLRADESLLYPKGDDPLALEHLPMTDGNDVWTRASKEGGMVRKLWRRISQKN